MPTTAVRLEFRIRDRSILLQSPKPSSRRRPGSILSLQDGVVGILRLRGNGIRRRRLTPMPATAVRLEMRIGDRSNLLQSSKPSSRRRPGSILSLQDGVVRILCLCGNDVLKALAKIYCPGGRRPARRDLTYCSITICLNQLAIKPRCAGLRLIFAHENKIYFALKFSPLLSF
jgi:hypothetical protein